VIIAEAPDVPGPLFYLAPAALAGAAPPIFPAYFAGGERGSPFNIFFPKTSYFLSKCLEVNTLRLAGLKTFTRFDGRC